MPRLYSARIVLSSLQRAGFSIISQKGSQLNFIKESDKIMPYE